jgi:hypothetical protein
VAKDVGTKPIADALVRAGLIENPDVVESVTITASAANGVSVTVKRFGDAQQVADALNELTEVGYRLVKEESETSNGD